MTLEILVAEDNESNQMLMVDMLDVLGHKATVGASGAETLALFKAANFDLVLSVNLRAIFLCAKAVGLEFRASRLPCLCCEALRVAWHVSE